MKQQLKIFYVTPEVVPFAKAGGLADVAGSFPKFLKAAGHDIRVMMPNYKSVNERRYVLRDVIRLQDLKVQLGDETIEASGKSAFIPDSKVQIYFLDNKELFERDRSEKDPKTGMNIEEDARRFLFFSIGCLETLKLLYWQPDIIHCNDWQTALIPMLLKRVYHEDPFFKECKTLLSIHDVTQQGVFEKTVARLTGLGESALDEFVNGDHFNFLRTGIQHADLFNLTSEALADEASDGQTKDELSDLLSGGDLVGINNGIDEQVWNPETDRLIPFNYSSQNPEPKFENKKELLKHFGFDENLDTPVLSTHADLLEQDVIDRMVTLIQQFLELDVRFISIGNGNADFSKKMNVLKKKHPSKLAFDSAFDPNLTHLLDAGSDFFLIPSQGASASLNPLYCLAYGTIPIVPKSPVFRDVVTDFQVDSVAGNGFLFDDCESDQILSVVKKALATYSDSEARKKILQNAMRKDSSWQLSAPAYIKLYQKLAGGRSRRR